MKLSVQLSNDKGVHCVAGGLSVSGKNGRASREYVIPEESFESTITSAVVEQNGSVRSVVRVMGKHQSVNGSREWLPFVLRFYFYAGLSEIKIVHSFVFDGDKETDFIKGLGITFDVPLEGEVYNRHVRFSGDTGFFAEPVQLLSTWRPRIPEEVYQKQISGQPVELEQYPEVAGTMQKITRWDSYKIVQSTSETYQIQKRTKDSCCWLSAGSGKRSGGLACIGSMSGGFAAGIRNFWQKSPASIELQGMTADKASFTLWFWSPDCSPMDLRHYDTETHVDSYYEGFEELRSTPFGIANTSEALLAIYNEIPDAGSLQALKERLQSPGLLVCKPEYYHQVRAFGPGACPSGILQPMLFWKMNWIKQLPFTRRKSTGVSGTVSGIMEISCIPTIPHVIAGNMIWAVMHGRIPNWCRPIGFGTASCVRGGRISSAWLKR